MGEDPTVMQSRPMRRMFMEQRKPAQGAFPMGDEAPRTFSSKKIIGPRHSTDYNILSFEPKTPPAPAAVVSPSSPAPALAP